MSEIQNDALIDDKPQVVNTDLRKFNKAKDQVDKALVAIAAITVTDQQSCDDALKTLGLAKKVESLIENKRKELVGPFNEAVKKINSHAKDLAGKLPPAIDAAKKKIIDWQRAEEDKAKLMRKLARQQQLLQIGGFNFDDNGNFVNGEVSFRNDQIENYNDVHWQETIARVVSAINERNAKSIQQKQDELEEDLYFSDGSQTEEITEQISSLKTPVAVPVVSMPAYTAPSVKGATKRWVFEVTDASLVPREYLIVDEKKLREAVGYGVREIAGVKIFQEDGLSIRK